jgi:hypothetical protein
VQQWRNQGLADQAVELVGLKAADLAAHLKVAHKLADLKVADLNQ